MPRPKNGYENIAGQKVPGVHDITGRYEDKSGLNAWKVNQAYERGHLDAALGIRTGEDRSALAIGTAIHLMCELGLRNADKREIEAAANALGVRDHIQQAWNAYNQFRVWRTAHHVEIISLEESIVSEPQQFGGTPDVVARIDGQRSLLDIKSCLTKNAGTVYLGQRIAMAAHGQLWNEKHSQEPIEAYHLLNLPKDGGAFGPHSFADLSIEWEMFTLQLKCWRLEKGTTRKRSVKASTPVEAPAEAPKVEAAPAAKPKRTRKPKVEAPAAPPVAPHMDVPPMAPIAVLSMAEILRSYGHVREVA